MKESLKERRVRFILIGFFMFLIVSAFLYRFDQQQVHVKQYPSMALVLELSNQARVNPVVALYEYKHNQHVLAIYEVERSNRFRFKARHAIELKDAPDRLLPDVTGEGIWANVRGDWIYFTQNLQEEKRDPGQRSSDSPFETRFQFDENESIININGKQSITMVIGEKPTGLHSLSENGSLWLVITETDIKIAEIETK